VLADNFLYEINQETKELGDADCLFVVNNTIAYTTNNVLYVGFQKTSIKCNYAAKFRNDILIKNTINNQDFLSLYGTDLKHITTSKTFNHIKNVSCDDNYIIILSGDTRFCLGSDLTEAVFVPEIDRGLYYFDGKQKMEIVCDKDTLSILDCKSDLVVFSRQFDCDICNVCPSSFGLLTVFNNGNVILLGK